MSLLTTPFPDTGNFYLNGNQTGTEQAFGTAGNFAILDEAYIGRTGHNNWWCDCELAEIEFYKRQLTHEEILHTYTRHILGENCLGN